MTSKFEHGADRHTQKPSEPSAKRHLDPHGEPELKPPADQPMDTDKRLRQQEAEEPKATQFDGNPSPQRAPSSPLKPKDDTPMKLEKREGPRDDQ